MRRNLLLPAGMGEKLQHRLIEFAAGMMVAIALIFALASYSANDPSLNTAALGDNVAIFLTGRPLTSDLSRHWACVAALRLCQRRRCAQTNHRVIAVWLRLAIALRIAFALACLIAFRRTGSMAPTRWAWRSCRRPCSFLDPRPLARFHSALVLRHRHL